MKTEPTDAEINEGISTWAGTLCPICNGSKEEDFESFSEPRRVLKQTCRTCKGKGTIFSYTTSFDALREAMGKMTRDQREELNVILWTKFRAIGQPCMDYSEWLLFHCPARTLAEAVYQVVKGENK